MMRTTEVTIPATSLIFTPSNPVSGLLSAAMVVTVVGIVVVVVVVVAVVIVTVFSTATTVDIISSVPSKRKPNLLNLDPLL